MPAEHFAHFLSPDLYEPFGQAETQLVEPEREYFPSAQFLQLVAPSEDEYFPALHVAHLFPECMYDPAGHLA